MILKACKSKNYTFYYVQKSYRTNDGKCSTKNVERLGTIEDLKARFGDFDPVGEARKYVAEPDSGGKGFLHSCHGRLLSDSPDRERRAAELQRRIPVSSEDIL